MKKAWIFCLVAFLFFLGNRAFAQESFDYPFLEYAPDGNAWTIREELPSPGDASNGVNPSCWYPDGETITVGRRNEQNIPGVGEHEYRYLRRGLVQVYQWIVTHSRARCIHNDEGYFHGIPMGNGKCRASYYSGWNAFCADCGERINSFYVYASRAKIRQLKCLNLDLDYYYLCPTCDHFEQGVKFEHKCVGISANRYQVKYLPNGGNVTGRMQPSFHVWQNATMFEGEEITPVKTLNLNVFARKGYQFIGWNRMPDGSGEGFEDGQEILNLTEENYDAKAGTGIVTLYAQWRRVSGELIIDAGNGSYLGKAGETRVKVNYAEPYRVDGNAVIAPQGFRVRFDPMGGKPIDDVIGEQGFEGWHLVTPAVGILQGEEYCFYGEDGDADRITAIYLAREITLPKPEREGYSFGGWYFDKEFTEQAGREGDSFTPKENVTLYANWVELVLEAELNLTCHDGKGAVDLAWRQEDEREKRYLLYQRREGEAFRQIHGTNAEAEKPKDVRFVYLGKEESYEIPLSGFYELEVCGAQGGNWQERAGGLGGRAFGKFWLEKGDVITVRVGGQNGDGGQGETGVSGDGGKGRMGANGGGSTRMVSKKLGLLLVAGGGGGASLSLDGAAGGSEDGLREDRAPMGQDGDIGGGAGYVGGLAGTYRVHVHTEACVHVHQGNVQSGGPCYEEVEEEKICREVVKGPFIEWSKRDDCLLCIASGRNGYGSVHPKCWWIEHHGCGQETDYGSSGWWECMICGHVGYQWGTGMNKPVVYDHTYRVTSYVLNCDQTYDCGNPEPVVTPAYGGSNYVKEDLAVTFSYGAGAQRGDGEALIHPVSVGFQETTELKEVFAPDLAAPRAIDRESVVIMPGGENRVKILFEEPEDLGTPYYHQAESYLAGKQECLSVSNLTLTNVVSGIAGYYFLTDEKEGTRVTEGNAENAGHPLPDAELSADLPESGTKFLHLAPVDIAGNVGESIHVDLSAEVVFVPWELKTSRIQVSSIIGSRDWGSVASDGENRYYVRADGQTPFLLSFSSEMLGKARMDYQIDRETFLCELTDGLGQGEHSVLLSHTDVSLAQVELSAENMTRRTSGRDVLQCGMYAKAVRTEYARVTTVYQSFSLDPSLHGKRICVIPGAGATFRKEERTSDREEDKKNQVILMGDGEAPLIHGWDQWEGAFQSFYGGSEEAGITLEAQDLLSGVSDFRIEVLQTNTGEMAVFHADENGGIMILLMNNEELFSGDVTVTAIAHDRVGNERILEYCTREFDLKTEIIRLLPPHDPIFQRGESGMLKITVRGYADALEVIFPEAFSEVDASLNRVIHYETPREVVSEEVIFMVPLELAEDGTYHVIVKAHKGEETLVSKPELSAIQVTGTILGEIRTRLR